MPDQYAGDEDGDKQQPVVFVPVGHGIMGAQHNEQYGQGDVVVMHGTLFGLETRQRVRLFAAEFGLHQFTLARNDDHEHIGDHDGAQHGADLNVSAASAEQVRYGINGNNQE